MSWVLRAARVCGAGRQTGAVSAGMQCLALACRCCCPPQLLLRACLRTARPLPFPLFIRFALLPLIPRARTKTKLKVEGKRAGGFGSSGGKKGGGGGGKKGGGGGKGGRGGKRGGKGGGRGGRR